MAPKTRGMETMNKGNATIIEVPLGDIPEGVPVIRHMDFRLRISDARTLRRVFEALRDRHTILETGKHVDSPHQAISWLLQEVSRQS